MTVCIQYSRPSSGQGEGEIYGLDVAVNNLLSAYFRYGTPEHFICRPTDIPSFDHFKALAQAAGVDAEKRCLGLDPRHPKNNLETITCLFRPDPLIGDLTWRRQQLRGPGYASCGLVHTMSGERIARAVGDLCVAPSDVTDALICPSESIRDAVRSLWDIHQEYLRYRFGGMFTCPVLTPVIPLGIDTDRFLHLTTADKRSAQRKVLGATDDEIVLLFLGRLSFATKAHPLALWQAAEQAARISKKKLRLIMYGYFKPKDMEPHFRGLAAEVGKTVKIEFVRNDDARFPDGLWAGADIFTSLSDNIQESFGLTPVEAMACGLPSIVSDWNGYRASVRDGLDGFLIPTLAPPASAGMAIAEAYYNEDNYGVSLMGAAQSTSVDIDACAKAIHILADNDGERLSFGDNGRKRAQHFFDWRYIIKAYEELWRELADIRVAGPFKRGVPLDWQAVHPSYPNPWKMFSGFPTGTMSKNDRVCIILNRDEVAGIMAHEMNYFLPDLLAPKDVMQELIEAIRRAGTPMISEILSAFPAFEHDRLWRCLGWIAKHGVCAVRRP